MILAVDIGNTNTTFGIFCKGALKESYITKTSRQERLYCKTVKQLLKRIKRNLPDVEDVIVCSVVPQATRCIKRIVKSEFKQQCIVVGKDIKVPIKNKYFQPKQVGQDRLVGAYAASTLYGDPLIIIDLGTAITMDVVSKNKEYLGGIIIPGIKVSLEVLFEKTALLPLVKIERPKRVIGRDTQGSILSGIFWGYGSMINGLIPEIKKEIKGNPKIVLTGGNANLMKSYLKYDTIMDADLIMKGLNMLGTKM